MSNITVRWSDSTHTTLIWEFPSLCTVDDIYAAGTLSSNMIANQGTDSVNLVLVLSRRGINQGNLIANLPPQTKRIAVVSKAMSAALLVSALNRAHINAVQVHTFHEAANHLSSQGEAAAGD